MIKYVSADGIIRPINIYKDLCIEKTLEYGDSKLSFSVPVDMEQTMMLEDFVRTETDEYVIKQVNADTSNGIINIVAQLNIDELEGNAIEQFESVEQTLKAALDLALIGTGWTCACDLEKRRTIRLTNTNTWKVVKQAVDTYLVEVLIDSINKHLCFVENVGEDRGVYFNESLNLKSLSSQGNTTEFYTRILPIGKDGLTIESVNSGSRYVSNYTYSSKVKTYIWKDERYTDLISLKQDAEYKLSEMCQPYISYSCKVVDLAKISKKYNFMEYSIGDTITLISNSTRTRTKQRIVRLKIYPDDLSKNTCEIANLKLTFEKYKQVISNSAETINNITTDNGTVSGNAVDSIDASKITNLDEVIAASGQFEQLSTDVMVVKNELTAVSSKIGNLETNEVFSTYANFKETVTEKLSSTRADIEDLTTKVNKTDTLIFGSASGTVIQTEFSNSVIANLGDAQIKSAMIEDISADKITGLDLNTSKFTVHSADGKSVWQDNTIQISDGTRLRVQIGKDAANDYNMYLWDKSGNLMFDALGLTESGVTRKIVRDDIVKDDANISASKLNIDSLFTVINADNSHTLKSSKIYFDEQAQSLDVAFKSMTNSVNGLQQTQSDQGAQLKIIQGNISSKVWQQDITTAVSALDEDLSADIETLSTGYSDISQTVEGIQMTVGSHTESLEGLDERMEYAESRIDINVGAISAKVSYNGVISAINLSKEGVTINANKINLAGYLTVSEFNALDIGGRNLIQDKYVVQFNGGTMDKSNFVKYGEIIRDENVTNGGFRFDSSTYYKPNTDYVLSGYITIIDGTVANFRILNGGKIGSFISFEVAGVKYGNPFVANFTSINSILNDKKQHYFELKFKTPATIPADTGYQYTYFQINSGVQTAVKYKLSGFKLEMGNKAAAGWAPAPEDISVENIYVAGTTEIDGAKIYTGSITANAIAVNSITGDKLNMNDVFSRNITATNFTLAGGRIAINTSNDEENYVQINGTDTRCHISAKFVRGYYDEYGRMFSISPTNGFMMRENNIMVVWLSRGQLTLVENVGGEVKGTLFAQDIVDLKILTNDMTAHWSREGLSYVVGGRCTITNGGYHQMLYKNLVYVQMRIRIETSLTNRDYWSLIDGFPIPDTGGGVSLACSRSTKTTGAIVTANIDDSGRLLIFCDSTISSGEYLVITGFYYA